jgi:hypothetical protein
MHRPWLPRGALCCSAAQHGTERTPSSIRTPACERDRPNDAPPPENTLQPEKRRARVGSITVAASGDARQIRSIGGPYVALCGDIWAHRSVPSPEGRPTPRARPSPARQSSADGSPVCARACISERACVRTGERTVHARSVAHPCLNASACVRACAYHRAPQSAAIQRTTWLQLPGAAQRSTHRRTSLRPQCTAWATATEHDMRIVRFIASGMGCAVNWVASCRERKHCGNVHSTCHGAFYRCAARFTVRSTCERHMSRCVLRA